MVASIFYGNCTLIGNNSHEARPDKKRKRIKELVHLRHASASFMVYKK